MHDLVPYFSSTHCFDPVLLFNMHCDKVWKEGRKESFRFQYWYDYEICRFYMLATFLRHYIYTYAHHGCLFYYETFKIPVLLLVRNLYGVGKYMMAYKYGISK
jgi:hypothetical protein